MDFTFIKDNTLLIVPDNIKDVIFEYLNTQKSLIDVKFMSIEELVKKCMFDYDEQTILYILNKYNIKPNVAKIYLDNLYYINKETYNTAKLNFLVDLKNELIDNKLLIIDNYFRYYLKNKTVIIYGYDNINKLQNSVLNNIKKITTVELIENKNVNDNKVLNVYEFETLEEEVNHVANEIVKLINKGVDINDIYLSNVQEEYLSTLHRIFSFYNIPLDIDNNISIYETVIGSKFLDNCKIYDNLNDALEALKPFLSFENDFKIYDLIVNICNNYSLNEINDNLLKCLRHDLSKIKTPKNKLLNAIRVIDLKNNIVDRNKYVFIMGFNQGTLPKIYKDEDYITDNLKDDLELETTLEKNIIEKQTVINILNRTNNLYISYKLSSPFETYYPSLLIEEMNMFIIKPKENGCSSFSNIYNKILLTKKLDRLVKFGETSHDLDTLYNTYNNIKYRTYDNKFNKIDINALKEYLDNKLLLSYSSIDKFYRCKFRYYINNILKLDSFEETFPMFVGSMFHYILSICFDDEFNFEIEWNKYLKDKNLSSKDTFFLEKLKTELIFIIDTIKEQAKLSSFDMQTNEEKFYINKNRDIKITFMGVIDKIMYKQKDGKTLLAIIDYKTGFPETSLNNTIYGIEMQLPVYLYLVIKSNKFSNIKPIGIYYQKILNNETILKPTDDPIKVKKDTLKLIGYSTNNESLLEQFDYSYKDSSVIKSMKVSKNGFYNYSKVLSEEKFIKLTEIVDNKVDEAIDGILSGDFEINPKRIGQKLVGCEFCNFKDLCYMNEKDIVNLKEHHDLDFLGCDIDG